MRTTPIETFVAAPIPRLRLESETGNDLDDLFGLDDRPVAGREATRIARAIVERETDADASALTVRVRPPTKTAAAAFVTRNPQRPAIWFYGKRHQTLSVLLHEVAHATLWYAGARYRDPGAEAHGEAWRTMYATLACEFGLATPHEVEQG